MIIPIPIFHLEVRDFICDPSTFECFDYFDIDENFLQKIEDEYRILSIDITSSSSLKIIKRYRFFNYSFGGSARTLDYFKRHKVEANISVRKLDIPRVSSN